MGLISVSRAALADGRMSRWPQLVLLTIGCLLLRFPARLLAQEGMAAVEQPSASTAASGTTTATEPLRHIFAGGVPKSLEELRLMDTYQRALVQKLTPATVLVRIHGTQGSGVIISPDGYVLTAAHVAGRPGLSAEITLSNGRKVRGTTLGMNKNTDAGLIMIDATDDRDNRGSWPFAKMGRAADLHPGAWCLALGHAGGTQKERPEPLVRFGRILVNAKDKIETDCKLIGGDSGGPLFDMQGRVIGIHSRIGNDLSKNVHVPVDTFRQTWDRLASGESWGSLAAIVGPAFMGVGPPEKQDVPKVARVVKGSPAERAGIQLGDLITQFDGQQVNTFTQLQALVGKRQPGDRVAIELKRGDQRILIRLALESKWRYPPRH